MENHLDEGSTLPLAILEVVEHCDCPRLSLTPAIRDVSCERAF